MSILSIVAIFVAANITMIIVLLLKARKFRAALAKICRDFDEENERR